MKIYNFSQQGKRSNNEDSLGMSAALLTVCDGMGGHNYGERASAFVKEAMLKAFAEPQQLGKMDIQQQLNQVQTDLNLLLEKEPELEKMGTTFTGVFITPDVWYAAHIGDSRIYLFRPSEQKLWHTWDHSLVGELMRTKEITIEAGRFHPMSNRISKAIIAQKGGKIASASIVKIDELKQGDILLLCSDGVVEGWGDLELVKLFSDESLSFEQKCEKLAKQCNEKSKDNNTAIIAEIEEGDAFSYGNNDELEWTTFAEVEADYNQYVKDNEEVKEEVPKSEVPVSSQPKEERQIQETKKPEKGSVPQLEPVAASRQAAKPVMRSGKTEKKSINKLLSLLLALVLIAIVGMVVLLKNRASETIDPDTKAFEACKTAADYRSYLSDFGRNALHYNDAKAFIDKYVADSIQQASAEQSKAEAQAAQDELEKRERKAYEACNTIGACDRYLRVYPKGKYVKEVKKKKAELEKRVRDEAEAKAKAEAEQKAQAEAEKKEEEAYKKCTTIEACEEYLKDYPDGRYKIEIQAKKDELMNAKEQAKKSETEQVEEVKQSTPATPTENGEESKGGKPAKNKSPELSPEQKELVGGVAHQTVRNNNKPVDDTVNQPKKE